jgi:hypothetical protein
MKRRSLWRPEEAFSEAVELLRTGGSIDAFLGAHPGQSAELSALLDTVATVRASRAVPARPPEVAAASRERFMAAAARTVAAPERKLPVFAAWWAALCGSFAGPRRLTYAMAALLVVVLLLGLSTTRVITVAASALPGDPLYRVKLAGEQAQLLLARDLAARQAVEQSLADRRIQEAQAITQLQRPVLRMAIGGVLEALGDAEWQIAGLKIGIGPRTRISGEPELGAQVSGAVQAPGDGTLIALELNVQSTRRPGAVPAATDTATPTATSQPPTPTATTPPATPTTEPRGVIAATQTIAPTSTPIPTSSPTSTPTATRTRTPVPTVRPSPIPLRPTPESLRKFGTVAQIDGYVWTIKEVDTVLRVVVNASTEWVNKSQLGDRVDVTFVIKDGINLATRIERTGGPDATPEPMDFAGLIQRLDGEWWTVRGISFRVSNETEIEGEPGIDRHAEVHAERRAGEEIWAKRITVRTLPEYEFTGAIETIGRDWLIVRGVTVSIDNSTKFLGDPPMVGRLADVQAMQFADGRLMARAIYTRPPTPTPMSTATRGPTQTEPPPSPTLTFTWTPSPRPQTSDTPTATPSFTLQPTASDTPTATPSFTPQPTASNTPGAAVLDAVAPVRWQ